MLTLTRRLGQSAIIRTPAGEKIEVKITDIEGGKIRLSFIAPRHIEVNREELDMAVHPEDYKE